MSLSRVPTPLAVLVALCLPLLTPRVSPAGPPGPWVYPSAPGTPATAAPTSTPDTPAASSKPPSLPAGGKKPPLPGVPGVPGVPGLPTPVEIDGLERTRRVTVVIERGKKPVGLGVMLSEKGVILTARSPITTGISKGEVEIRFPDTGVVAKVKMIHEDEAWDLALLQPVTPIKTSGGAKPSDVDPLSPTSTFSTFVLLKTGKLAPQTTAVLGRRDYLSPERETLKDALSVDPKNVAIGTPLVDSAGGVVAVVGRACAPGPAKPAPTAGKTPAPTCTPALFGVPLSAMRKFLRTAIVKTPSATLGIYAVSDRIGVRVLEVTEGGAAGVAGIKGGSDPATADTILAFDGVLLRSGDDLGEQVRRRMPGEEVKLLVSRAGVVREVKVTLQASGDPAIKTPGPSVPMPVPPPPFAFPKPPFVFPSPPAGPGTAPGTPTPVPSAMPPKKMPTTFGGPTW